MPDSIPSRAPLKQIDFLVLAVLHDESRHGYGIVQEIEAMTGGRVRLRPGDVYRVLYRLQRERLLEADEAAGDGDQRRSYYRITEGGRRVVRAEAEWLAGVSARLLTGSGR